MILNKKYIKDGKRLRRTVIYLYLNSTSHIFVIPTKTYITKLE